MLRPVRAASSGKLGNFRLAGYSRFRLEWVNLGSICVPNTLCERKLSFQNLHEFFFTGSELIIGGDFNCIDSQRDKYGGNFDTGFVGKQ